MALCSGIGSDERNISPEADAPPRAKRTLTGDLLLTVSLLALGFNVVFFARDLSAVPDLLTGKLFWQPPAWNDAIQGESNRALRHLSEAIVGVPVFGLLGASFFSVDWLRARGRMSRRRRLVWLLFVCLAVLGWPVACGCLVFHAVLTGGAIAY